MSLVTTLAHSSNKLSNILMPFDERSEPNAFIQITKWAWFCKRSKEQTFTKLLVLAKREWIKQEFKKAQDPLTEELPQLLPTTVQDLMNHFGAKKINSDVSWPVSPVDIQVYLHHKIREGQYRIMNNAVKNTDNLVSPLVTMELIETPEQ
jgi:hypothetical protein